MISFVRYAVVVVLYGFLTSCTTHDQPEQRSITFWHFWSEPQQRQVLDSLLEEFERLHPTIDVVPSELAWSDGMSKLQLAFNSGTAPDVVHTGLDWFAVFAEGGAIQALSFVDTAAYPTYIGAAVMMNGLAYAAPWTMNVRAHVRRGAAGDTTWGLCIGDPHNVLKRTLPLVWKFGAPDVYRREPIVETLDERCVQSLDSLRRTLAPRAVFDQSRSLDDALRKGALTDVYTGAWIYTGQDARERAFQEEQPSRSILNADVLCMSSRCTDTLSASVFVRWITSDSVSKAFTNQIPDAGMPVHTSVLSAYPVDERPIFYRTAMMSVTVPTSPRLLETERIVEEMIERALRASSLAEVRYVVEQARSAVLQRR
ncbi:MAG TPA: extracellular solute-binding protein [Chlorobiota bacterium]|nr:extracellular solute-binding protein [Chlorobiota bacterium]